MTNTSETPRGLSSMYLSSDTEPDTPDASESQVSSSDIASELASLSLDQPCGPCKEEAANKVFLAKWFCQDCDDYLCQNCKADHDELKIAKDHQVVEIKKLCGQCERKGEKASGNWFCSDCDEYLCDKCKASHRKFKLTKNHRIGNSQDTSREWKHGATKELLEGGSDQGRRSSQRCVKPLSERKAKLSSSFNVKIHEDKEKPSITSSFFLLDGRLLLLDYNNKKLKVFNERFHFDKEKVFDSFPYRMAVYDENEVAVILENANGGRTIKRLSVDKDIAIKKSKTLGIRACGIDYLDGDRLIVTNIGPAMVHVINIDGQLLSSMSTDRAGKQLFSHPIYLTVDRERFRAYVSDELAHKVYAIDTKVMGDVFIYKHTDLKLPTGIALDKEGNLYVCGEQSNNLHQISPSGQLIKIIASNKDGVQKPNTISFTPDGNRFIVGNLDEGPGETVHVFTTQ